MWSPTQPSTPPRSQGDVSAEHRARLDQPSAAQNQLMSPTGFRSPRSPVTYSDRFIPSRAAAARLNFSLLDRESVELEAMIKGPEREDSSAAYTALLRSELLDPGAPASPGPADLPTSPSFAAGASPVRSPVKKMFRYQSGGQASTAGSPVDTAFNTSPVGREPPMGAHMASPKRALRKIPRAPFKVLDAPHLQEDFYLNLVDWSSQNILAVGLESSVYLWSATTSKVTKMCDLGPANSDGDAVSDTVCSVGWSQRGTFLALGVTSGATQIWDIARNKCVRTLGGHRQRVGALAWGNHLLSTGSRDRHILHHDIRAPGDYVHRLNGHRSEVCGLKWSPDDRELASGGNDNQLFIWNPHSQAHVTRFGEHTAAVKAIAWSPHQHGLLASGGGTADRTIRFWNTATSTALSNIDTGSQVCNLSWSKNVNEIVSTHGYSQNQIIVWRHPTMTKLATLTGHTMRVLYLATSPDGQTIVTGAGDETLRFWNVFPGSKSQSTAHETAVNSMMRAQIR
ncbi:hypothetical protein WJX73_008551 [Symbiochloris irregularis]|uniref:CDC20/Fizzy WD40 domain-containing protein n=1 Tax=Symbiochloris irregularis TaxID=706552 RepID=A0AAW1P5C5_9CHLO